MQDQGIKMPIGILIDKIKDRTLFLKAKIKATESKRRKLINKKESIYIINGLGNEIANYKNEIQFLFELIG